MPAWSICLGSLGFSAALSLSACIVVEQAPPRKDAGSGDATSSSADAAPSLTDGGSCKVTSQGPNQGSVAEQQGESFEEWTSLPKATAFDNSYAEAVLGGNKFRTKTLVVRAFGFQVPKGARVLGVEMSLKRASASGTVTEKDVNLYINGKGFGDRGGGPPWAKGPSDPVTMGGPTDLWLTRCSNCAGVTELTPEMINDPRMGLGIAAWIPDGGATDTAQVDGVSAKVYYCE
jgi:hypothetical protein